MRTRPSLVLLALVPWVGTIAFFAGRGAPLSFWLAAWPILPFIATALGALFIVIRDAEAARAGLAGGYRQKSA